MAFGKLGWTPLEYYSSSPYEFFAACEGYFDNMDSLALMHRSVATIVYRALGGKENITRAWPIGRDKPTESIAMLSKDEYENILKAHKIN